jgi:hypothetical protein
MLKKSDGHPTVKFMARATRDSDPLESRHRASICIDGLALEVANATEGFPFRPDAW